MELFRRKFLSFFCFLFLTTSLFLYMGDFENKLRLIISLLIVIATILILMAVLKKCRIALLCVLLCCCSITCAAANSFLRIDYHTLKAQEYVGDFDAQMSILECKYVSGNSATYIVRLDKLGESNVAIKALLVCGFSTELSMGDRVFANVEIVGMEDRAFGLTGRERSDDPEVMLTAVLYDGVEATVERFDHEASFVEKLFYKNGARVLFEEIRTDLKIHIDETFGENIGALAKGYLLGDKSDISTDVIRDFRRSGVSHLFAVSGLHISILLGAVELLLRKLWVDKRIRCVIISILSVVLLILTGFSISALRAVFMLWIVYLVFLFSEEADPPTTLFVSVAIIILFFPYAIGELGLWMSFLATLGLVTVYPVAEEYIRKIPDGKGSKRISVKISKSAVLIVVMTVTANVFLLPIQWWIFGEISLVSVVTNVLISPLSAVFLIGIVAALIFGRVWLVGDLITYLVCGVGRAILHITKGCSTIKLATVSLKYFFADILVPIFIVAMVILLLVRLKRKWLIAVPVVCFAMAFGACVVAFEYISPKKATYYQDGNNQTISVTSGSDMGIIDASGGSYSRFAEALYDASDNGATSADFLVFTHLSESHIASMEYFFRSNIVNRVYISAPRTEKQRELSVRMAQLANDSSVECYVYENGSVLELNGVSVCLYNTYNDGNNATAVFLSAGEEIIGYVDANIYQSEWQTEVDKILSKCRTVVIGNERSNDEFYDFPVKADATVIYTTEQVMKQSEIFINYNNCYYSDTKKLKLTHKMK